jgi:hypothetical protein
VTLSLALSDVAAAHAVLLSATDTTYWERQQTQEAGISYTWRTARSALTPALSYRHQRLSGLNDLLPGFNPFWTGHLASLKLACRFSDAHAFGFSISPERGRSLFVEAAASTKLLGSQIDQNLAWARWTEYLPLPLRHHVLMLDGRFGVWQARGRSHFEDATAFDLRGYDSGLLFRKYRSAATAEYRFPLLRIERGIGTWPFYLRNVHGAAYAEAAAQASVLDRFSIDRLLQSVGAELRSDWLFSYAVPVRVKLGYARTFAQPLQQMLYWAIGMQL